MGLANDECEVLLTRCRQRKNCYPITATVLQGAFPVGHIVSAGQWFPRIPVTFDIELHQLLGRCGSQMDGYSLAGTHTQFVLLARERVDATLYGDASTATRKLITVS